MSVFKRKALHKHAKHLDSNQTATKLQNIQCQITQAYFHAVAAREQAKNVIDPDSRRHQHPLSEFWANQRDKMAYATTLRLCAIAAADGLHVCDKSRHVPEDNNSLRQHRIDTSCRPHRSPRLSGGDLATARVGAEVEVHVKSAHVMGWIQRVY